MMKAMKKILLIAIALFMAIGAASAKDASEIRIYLNAGHGSWGPGDRPMATIPYPALASGRPDTCGFYESNTNLWKILKLGATLEKMGIKHENIMYSRVKNGPYPYVSGATDEDAFNRNLSEICTEVEANNMDMFLSVHSNAASEGTTTNYPLFIYRGKDGDGNDYAPGSRAMGTAMWPIFYTNQIDPQSYYSPTDINLRGDVSFYGSEGTRTDPNSGKSYSGYLGVLKHGTPGMLIEGYFHTYQPARHRALNSDYCGQEGVRYARGIAQYFGIAPETTGYIMGTVKDLHEKMSNTLFKYTPKTNDQWVPLNGAVVTLYKGGTKVADYTVDNNYNGVFVFQNLQPGSDYTLDITATGYKALTNEYKGPYTVTANSTTYPMVYMESVTYEPPKVVYTDYPDPTQPAGTAVPAKFNMKQEFINSAAALTGKIIRRSILRGDSLYVLALDATNNPYIYLINPETQAIVKEIPTTGTQGSIYGLSDIAFTADNYLIGCNKGLNQYSDSQVDAGTVRGTFRAYKWAKDANGAPDGDPAEWFTSQSSGNYYRVNIGQTLAVTGASDDCKVMTTAVTTGSSASMRFIEFNIVNNVVASSAFINNTISTESNYTETKLGNDFKLNVSPRDADQYIIDGNKTTPIEFHSASQNVDAPIVSKMADSSVSAAATGATYFKYGKHSMMATPECDANGKNVGVKLFDITNGLDKAVLVKTTNTTIDPKDAGSLMAAGLVDGVDLSIYLTNNDAISKFTTKDVEQPKIPAIYAYNLNMTDKADSYDITFDANSDATEAYLVLKDPTSGNVIKKVAIPSVVAGSNTFNISKQEIPTTGLNWAIELAADPVTGIKVINNPSNYTYVRARGVVVNALPETDHFGKIYVADNKGKLLYAYNPDGSLIGSYNGGTGRMSSTGRMAMMPSGKPCIAEWADANSGIWIVDPSNLSADFANFFDFATKDSDGKLFNTANEAIGSSTPGICFFGSGDDTKLYAYLEDFGNNVGVYNIGTAESWNKAPNTIYEIGSLQANTNGNVIADYTGGCWVSQVRGSGNNAAGVPSLIYVNASGKVTFNSGVALADVLDGSYNGGFAISPDEKQLIINNASKELCVFDINWTEEDTPELKLNYKVGCDVEPYQMSWDFAGNLYLANTSLTEVSFPKADNRATTPAKKSLVLTGTATGIGENVIDNVKLAAYPNPTTSSITVTAPEAIVSVKVFSTTGALVAQSNNANVDMSNLASGIYLVKVNNLKAIQVIKK